MKMTLGVDIKKQKQKCGDQHRLFSSYRGPQSRSLGSFHGYTATARGLLRGCTAVPSFIIDMSATSAPMISAS